MTRQPNPAYDPPMKDPREEGVQHWDTLRTELMVTRDALRSSEIDRESQARRIDDLNRENARLTKLREADQNECIVLRTSLENVGRMILAILKGGALARKGDSEFAPSVLQHTIDGQIKEIEDALQGNAPKFLVQGSETQQ